MTHDRKNDGTSKLHIRFPTIIVGAILFLPLISALAGGTWIVDDVVASNKIEQTQPAATNVFMGNLGIGTNAPAEKLHVEGTARFEQGVKYGAPLGDLSMGIYTNKP